jgi:hypothetical protein
MPMKHGGDKKTIRENTSEMIRAGHDPKQAYAAANRQARSDRGKKAASTRRGGKK